MRVTIKMRLALAVGVTLCTVLAMGTYSLRVQDRLNSSIADLEVQSDKISLLSATQLAVEQSLMPGNDYIITGKSSYSEKFNKISTEIHDLFAQIQTRGIFTPEELNEMAKVHELFDGVQQISEQIFSRRQNDPGLSKLMEKMDYQYGEPLVLKLSDLKHRSDATFRLAKQEAAELRLRSRQVSFL